MDGHIVELKDQKERPVTITVNPDNTFSVMRIGKEPSTIDGTSLYRCVTDDLAYTPYDFICHFRYLPLMAKQTVVYPARYKKRVDDVLKTVYRLLSRHDLTYLLDTPMYFYGEVSSEIQGKHITAFGKKYISVRMSSKTVMVDVLLHELGHELYSHFSFMSKFRIAAKFHTMRKKLSFTLDGKFIKLYGQIPAKYRGVSLKVDEVDDKAVYFSSIVGTGDIPLNTLSYVTVLAHDGETFTHHPRSTDTYFPTQYSMVDPEEWWCELFSRTMMGEMTGKPAAFVQSLIARHKK